MLNRKFLPLFLLMVTARKSCVHFSTIQPSVQGGWGEGEIILGKASQNYIVQASKLPHIIIKRF